MEDENNWITIPKINMMTSNKQVMFYKEAYLIVTIKSSEKNQLKAAYV